MIRATCLAVLMLIALPFPALAERVALVIGMGAYQNVTPLKNTLNDAKNIAAKLQEVGFNVTLATDKTQSQLLDIMQTFSFQAETADLALIYYAGPRGRGWRDQLSGPGRCQGEGGARISNASAYPSTRC